LFKTRAHGAIGPVGVRVGEIMNGGRAPAERTLHAGTLPGATRVCFSRFGEFLAVLREATWEPSSTLACYAPPTAPTTCAPAGHGRAGTCMIGIIVCRAVLGSSGMGGEGRDRRNLDPKISLALCRLPSLIWPVPAMRATDHAAIHPIRYTPVRLSISRAKETAART
jgi:hypothetical protein